MAILNNDIVRAWESPQDETLLPPGRFIGMEQTSSQEARNLRALAVQLRQSAFETDDEAYIELFLRAARELEDRIYDGAGGSTYFLN